jgi:hypothetical protein
MQIPSLILSWAVTIFVVFLEIFVIWLILTGRIKLERLISEPDGSASLARFQFLLFTFVIATSFFLVVIGQDPPGFPDRIPPEVLVLLGLSGGSYLISQGIQSYYLVRMRQAERATTGQESMRPEP